MNEHEVLMALEEVSRAAFVTRLSDTTYRFIMP